MEPSESADAFGTAAIDVRSFASLVASTRRAGRPGLSIIAVNLRPLEASLELQLVRDALLTRLWRWSRNKEAKLYNVDARAVFVVPKQSESELLQASSEVRTAVGYLVGPRAQAIELELRDLVQILHTGRDIQAISTFLRTHVQIPKALDTPIEPAGPLSDTHLAALRARIDEAGAVAFVREFGRLQPLARLNDQGDPDAVGAERFVAMQHLRSTLLSKVTLDPAAGDYERVGQELDRAVLRALAEEDPQTYGHLTVNLTVETFLSDSFAQFARDFAARRAEGELWLELPIEPALANLEDFRERQRALRDHRVFTMADRVQPEMLERMKHTNLDFDGFKLPADPGNITLENLRKPIEGLRKGRARVAITRIEHSEQLAAAFFMGVRHVQGYLIDRLLARLDLYEQSS